MANCLRMRTLAWAKSKKSSTNNVTDSNIYQN
nr:MAG TPA: hypothetical protein [Caudoviricetes sp.]